MLTEVEKKYARQFDGPDDPPGLHDDNPEQWPRIRESMKRTAYHEAGHFVARIFTRLEISHILKISIIGNEKMAGCVTSERNFAEITLETQCPPIQRSHGRMLLLHSLAGYGAELIINDSYNLDLDSIDDYLEWIWYDEENDESSDIYRANRICKIMAKPFPPARRIFKLAEKWTLEMLNIPAVWKGVETVAAKLIEQGEITDDSDFFSDIVYNSKIPTAYDLPKWDRRLLIQPGELDKYIEHV